MKHVPGIFTATIVLLLAGCATVPMAPLDQVTRAKEFLPVPNKASLYIYRNESMGAAIPMTVTINGKALGQTAAQTYFRFNVLPGKYNVESQAENISSLPLTVEPEKNYFVWQEIKMGMWMARSLLQQVDDKTGRAGVTESKLIASTLADADLAPLDSPSAMPSSAQGASSESVSQKLRELQSLRRDGVITEDDFQKKKQQLLEQL